MDFLGVHFAGASRVIYFPVFLFFIWLFFKNFRRVKIVVARLVHFKNKKLLFGGFSVSKQRLKTWLLSLSLVLIFLALLQPQWGKKENTVVQEGRDLLIVLDISRSMLAQDLKPSRLEFTKLKIRNLLNKLSFERVGLMLFSGSAFLQCPMTSDYSAFLMFLDQVDVETIASGTTSIDKALQKSINVFSRISNRKNKLVLLATDGEDFSTQLKSVKRLAKEQDIKVIAWGIGTTDGAPVPKIDSYGRQVGHETEQDGTVAMTKLDEKKLKDLTEFLSGDYVKSTLNDSDLNRTVKFINKFEKEKFTDKKISMYEDQYPWLLGVAWIFLVLEWLL